MRVAASFCAYSEIPVTRSSDRSMHNLFFTLFTMVNAQFLLCNSLSLGEDRGEVILHSSYFALKSRRELLRIFPLKALKVLLDFHYLFVEVSVGDNLFGALDEATLVVESVE